MGGLVAAFLLAGTIGLVAQTAFYQRIALGTCMLQTGAGTPEGAVVGSPCDLFLRTDGAAGTTLYVKQTGAATNTGWGSFTGTPVAVASGGTGLASYTVGDLVYASAADVLSKLAGVAAGSYVRSGGVATAPVWSTLILPNAAAQGELPTATAANTVSMLAVGSAGALLRSGGPAANNAWTTLTFPATIAQGEIPTATAANAITALAVGTAGDYLRSGGAGANVAWRSFAYADAYLYDNAAALTIDTVDVYHAVTGFSAGTLSGFTFGASLDGMIASVAEGVPADGKVTVTDVAHGLTSGDLITIHASTDYDGTYLITKLTDDTFEITAAWTATRTGEWHRPSTLIAGAGGAGPYRLCWNISLFAAFNGKRYKLEANVGITAADNIVAEYQAGVNTAWQSVGACGIVTLAASDPVWLSIKGLTDATDVTVVHANFNLTRIGG